MAYIINHMPVVRKVFYFVISYSYKKLATLEVKKLPVGLFYGSGGRWCNWCFARFNGCTGCARQHINKVRAGKNFKGIQEIFLSEQLRLILWYLELLIFSNMHL